MLLLSQVGITLEAGLAKARMMALLALAARSGLNEVPFSAVQTALDVPANQVETHIIGAIGARLLEAKVDQIKGVVAISRYQHISFGKADWGKVRKQLHAYCDSLVQVSQAMASAQQ